jgi:hypothetical protein
MSHLIPSSSSSSSISLSPCSNDLKLCVAMFRFHRWPVFTQTFWAPLLLTLPECCEKCYTWSTTILFPHLYHGTRRHSPTIHAIHTVHFIEQLDQLFKIFNSFQFTTQNKWGCSSSRIQSIFNSEIYIGMGQNYKVIRVT